MSTNILLQIFPPISFRNIIYEYYPIISFYLFTLDLVFRDEALFMVIGTMLIFPYFIKFISNTSSYKQMLTLFLLMMVGGLLNMINTENGMGGLIIVIGHFSMAVYCMEHLSTIKWHSLSIIAAYSYFIIHQIMTIGYENSFVMFEEYGVSRNAGGAALSTFTVFYVFANYLTTKKIPFVVPLLVIVPTYMSVGRSSIAALLFLALICFLRRGSKKMTLLFLMILVVALFYFQSYIQEYYELSSFATKGIESTRSDIWASYFNNMSLMDFIIGPDTVNFPVIKLVEGNPHNMFLNIHRRFGIFVVLFFVICIVKSIYSYWKKDGTFIPLLIGVIIFRAFFDSMFFVSRCDFVVLTILFYVFYRESKKQSLFYNLPIQHTLNNHKRYHIESVRNQVVT